MTDDGPGAVLVLGAGGALGSLVAAEFRREGWRVLAGRRQGSPAPDVRRVDLDMAPSVESAVDEVDVVVSTVPDAGLRAERTVLRRGGALVNLSALPAATARTLDGGAAGARGRVLMNAGIAPGLTNLVAADLLAAHPDADEIEMVFTVAVRSTAGRAAADFAHRGLTARSRHRTVRVPLPAPFGPRRCLGFAEPDEGWLDVGASAPPVRTYVCFAEPAVAAALQGLHAARVLAFLPRALLRAGSTGAVAAPSREPVAHWVALRRDGRRIAARTIEGRGDFRMAAATAVMFAEALLGRRYRDAADPGPWTPERLIGLATLQAGLDRAGIHVVDQPCTNDIRGVAS